MKSKQNMYARTEAVTVSVRPAAPRMGTTYTHVLNGTLTRSRSSFLLLPAGERSPPGSLRIYLWSSYD